MPVRRKPSNSKRADHRAGLGGDSSYSAWKAAAAAALERGHSIRARAIPENVWTRLYVGRMPDGRPRTPADGAADAAAHYRASTPASRLPPAWLKPQ